MFKYTVLFIVLTGCATGVIDSKQQRVIPDKSLLGDPCEIDSDCRSESLVCKYQICTEVER